MKKLAGTELGDQQLISYQFLSCHIKAHFKFGDAHDIYISQRPNKLSPKITKPEEKKRHKKKMKFLILLSILGTFGDLIGFNRLGNTVLKHRGEHIRNQVMRKHWENKDIFRFFFDQMRKNQKKSAFFY